MIPDVMIRKTECVEWCVWARLNVCVCPVCVLCSRVGQRGGGLASSAARSEHEVSEIIDGISEQEVSLACLPSVSCPLSMLMLMLTGPSQPLPTPSSLQAPGRFRLAVDRIC